MTTKKYFLFMSTLSWRGGSLYYWKFWGKV